MKDEIARDKAIEKLVAERLRRAAMPAGPACADEQILAAYVEGTLAPKERVAWETHFAGCARCQVQVAELVRLSPSEAPAEIRHLPIRIPAFRWAWAAPALVVVIAAGLWFTGEFTQRSRQANPIHPETTTPAATAASNAPTKTPETLRAPEKKPPVEARKAEEKESPLVSAKPEAAPAEANAEEAAGQTTSAVPASEAAKVEAEPAAPSAGIVTPSERAQLAAKTAAPTAESPAPAAQSATPPAVGGAAPPSAAQAADQVVSSPKPKPSQEEPAAATTDSRRREGTVGALALMKMAGAEQAAPRWRVGRHGLIEKADAQGNWNTVPSGVEADLNAVACASRQTCWAVGQAGTILRTTDGGKQWLRVSPPAQDDLTHVTAASGNAATVTTRDGRRFATTDGGKTWQAVEP